MPDLIGFRKTSLVDYPGKVAATLFFPGCNLRCPWCHNRELVIGGPPTPGEDFVAFEAAFSVIARRRSVLGGVVFTGGEPLLRGDLGELIARVKLEGLPVKVDTNGTQPRALEKLLSSKETAPDFIAMDLKLSPQRCGELGASNIDGYRKSIEDCSAVVSSSGVKHEYRSIVLPEGEFAREDVIALAPLVDSSPWFFSAFRPGNCLDERWNEFPQSSADAVARFAREAIDLGKDGKTR